MNLLNAFLEKLEDRWPWVNYDFYENSVLRWLIALVVAILAFFVLRVVQRILQRRARSIADATTTRIDDGLVQTLEATKMWFLLIISLYFGSLVLILQPEVRRVAESVAIITLLLQAAFWGSVLLEFALRRYTQDRLKHDAAAATTISAMNFIGKIVLWALVLILALDNMGIDVTAMVAGLGVGGIAVALAAQNILGDLFASLSIVFDKPFVLGDFIIVGEHMGSVEKIGLKTTRLRSLSGEQLIFANNDLLQSRIRNYKRMFERRIVFTLGVTYETPLEKLELISGMIREVVESHEQVRFDRAHFKAYGDFSLNFEVVYYVLVPDYNQYMDIQQSINLKLFRRFAEEEIEFAYPTQRLLLERS